MKTKSLKFLAVIVVGLIATFLIMDQGRNSKSAFTTLVPELKSQINDINSVMIQSADDTVTIAKSGDTWTVRERSDYAADVGALRGLIIALADARIIEQKTSKPEKYYLIGVNDPEDEKSEAVEVTIEGEGFEHVVILGKVAQSSFRYARVASEAQSVLIDQNPDLPDDAGGWLVQDLLAIAAERVNRITIEHSDGETIEIEKDPESPGSFNVVNIPAGRELSYAGVANGIGGILSDLSLDDVREAAEKPVTPDVIVSFSIDDGMAITAAIVLDDGTSWISIEATGDEIAEGVPSEADRINSRVAGWQYTLPDYKTNLLKRRFEDLLKTQDAE